MSAGGGSAAREAAAIRARARRGVWRRVLAWLGWSRTVRRADARAALWEHGAAGEAVTAGLLAPLEGVGWHVRHDLRLPGSRANLDHVLVSPCGTGVVVVDTKSWHRGRPTHLVGGRVWCGVEDRHGQVEKVAAYAARVQAVLGLSGVVVWPLVVVHGSSIAGGELRAAVPGWPGPVLVVDGARLVPVLAAVPGGARDPRRAARVAGRVDQVLRPYR